MKQALLIFALATFTSTLFAQNQKPKSCYEAWEAVFKKRGAYAINDDMHRKVIVSFFEDGNVYCYTGKVRVESGRVTSVFIKYEDETFHLLDKKIYGIEKNKPKIENGISELIYTDDNEKFKVLFIEQIKPKKKSYESAPMPDDFLD